MNYWITDYIHNPSIEAKVLGKPLAESKKHLAEVVLVWHQKVDKDFLNSFPNLKGVVRYGVGYDNINLNLLKKKKIIFCNNPDYGVDEVSDTALAMIMNFSRRISSYNFIAQSLNSKWQEQTITPVKRSSETSVGIIGVGRIGSSLALKLNSIKFKTIFFDPYVPSGYEKTISSSRVERLEDLLLASDIISLHCPLNHETKNMVNSSFLKKMKKGAFLVNTARGQLIESNQLLSKYIVNRDLGGVALDVTIDEPPLSTDPLIEIWKSGNNFSQNIIINPHTAYYSKHSYKEMRLNAALKARAILKGKTPKDVID